MRLLILTILSSCLGVGQGTNSNSFDEQIFSPVDIDTSTPAGIRFSRAFNVISNKCVNCHTSTIHNTWAGFTTDQAWLDSIFVNQSDSQNSLLIRRLINNGSDMPQGGSALSDQEINDLESWIDGL